MSTCMSYIIIVKQCNVGIPYIFTYHYHDYRLIRQLIDFITVQTLRYWHICSIHVHVAYSSIQLNVKYILLVIYFCKFSLKILCRHFYEGNVRCWPRPLGLINGSRFDLRTSSPLHRINSQSLKTLSRMNLRVPLIDSFLYLVGMGIVVLKLLAVITLFLYL